MITSTCRNLGAIRGQYTSSIRERLRAVKSGDKLRDSESVIERILLGERRSTGFDSGHRSDWRTKLSSCQRLGGQ